MNEQIKAIIDRAREVSAIIRDMVPPSGRLVRGSPQMVTVKRAIESAASVDAVCDALEAAESRAEEAEARDAHNRAEVERVIGPTLAAMKRSGVDSLPDATDELIRRLDAADIERDALRAIIADCAAAIGNGSGCSKDASVEFMATIPAEIRAEAGALRTHAARLERRRAQTCRDCLGFGERRPTVASPIVFPPGTKCETCHGSGAVIVEDGK